jgi:murein DD-endopeptidase MepM/ murein hydrolase activator NlpD
VLKRNAVLVAMGTTLLALAAFGETAFAQRVFKYLDANGVWVYTDRQPSSDQRYEETSLKRSFEPAEVRLYQRGTAGGIALIAQSTYFGPVQIAFQLSETDNVAGPTRTGLMTLPARSETQVLLVDRQNESDAMSFKTDFQFLPGDPDAQHAPDEPYRLPFALASSFPVSQAFPESLTHVDPSSQHAIDFVMPTGTAVYAARAGIVIEVASGFFEAGLDPSVDGPRANLVRVLHNDGTMSLYAHLSWNSIRVTPGERVARGQYLADSGNTGFSSGPHLHFVVQRNRGGAMVSVPIEFAGPAGTPVTPRTGSRLTAY